MRTIKLTVEYDGTAYSGWQRQPNGLTVQEVLEDALKKLLGEDVAVRSSGRTDAGVHAAGMAAVFRTAREIPLKSIIDGSNHFLPPDIAIRDACEVSGSFRAIRDATAKHYRYSVFNSEARSPLRRNTSWHVREQLNLEDMRAAAASFVGIHDFASFRASNCSAKTSSRRIDSVEITVDGEMIFIDVTGEGFLKNMVRIMAGTLVDIGRGRFEPGHVRWLLRNHDRQKAGVTAPAQGLCLVRVYYGENV